MSLGGALDTLSRIVEEYESTDRSIREVDATLSPADSTNRLEATVDVPLRLCEADPPTPTTADVRSDGRLQVAFSSSILPEFGSETPENVSVSREDVRVTDGEIVVTFRLDIESPEETDSGTDDRPPRVAPSESDASEDRTDRLEPAEPISASDTDTSANGSADANEADADLRAIRDEDLRPYDDTEYLQALYDRCETFAEMRDRFEIDVSSETVRRYMIEAGVHEANSYDTQRGSDAAETQSENTKRANSNARVESDPLEAMQEDQLMADGIGLPDGLTIEELADAVENAMTLYQVQRRLELDRTQTQEILEGLNLIDLVMTRVSNAPETTVSREEIADRIRRSATA
ncbi:MAG: hypothetical protein PPP58_08680 [Natronomonas sp.]